MSQHKYESREIFAAVWAACDTFRGAVDPANYKNYVLTMLFLKYLSDMTADRREELTQKYKGNKTRVTRALRNERFMLPDESDFTYLYNHRDADNVGELINIALANLEDANKAKLDNAFGNVDFNSEAELGDTRERNTRLKSLLEDFYKIDVRPSHLAGRDTVGDAYEFLIGKFAAGAGKKAGEFYTPPEVSELLARLLRPQSGSQILDPACGSGSLLIKVAHQVGDDNFALFGQESNGSTWALCKQNMFLHRMDNARIERCDIRIRFYERFAAFARVLDVAMSSHRFLEKTPEKTVNRYRTDLKFFAELRRAVRIRYAEVVDFSEYEPKIRRLLDQYISTSDVEAITGKIDLYDRDQRAAALEAAGSATAKAETIASNVERVLVERIWHEDPATYRRLSAMLRDIIEQMRAGWLAAAKALIQIERVEEEVIRPKSEDVPVELRDARLAAVIYRNTQELLGDATADVALAIDRIIEDRAIVGWKDNPDRQKAMRQAIDDYLFDQNDEEGLNLSIEQIDVIIDTALERARAVLP